MNLKNFKKIHEDQHKAILQNQRGHQITLAKKQLSKGHLDGIGKLPLYAAEGIDVPEASTLDPIPGEEREVAAEAPIQPVQQPEPTEMPGGGGGPTPLAPQQIQKQPVAQAPEQTAMAHKKEMDEEAFKLWQDHLQGNIKPETYGSMFAKKDTLGKIGTIFGLMISGAGAGLTHQPNALLEMMNKEIDRDLEAQKKSVEGAQNYYRLNQQNEMNKAAIKRTGAETMGVLKDNELKSLTAAKNGMMLGATHKVLNDLNMLPNGSPMKQKGMQAFSGLQGAVSNEIQHNNAKTANALVADPEGSFQQSQQGLRTAGNLGILPGAENMAQANDERHVPGFGEFSNPVPHDVRQELIAKQEYDKAARNYVDFAKKHQGNWANLNPEERARIAREGGVLGAELQGKFRMKTHGGVYKEGEQKFIEGIIPNNATSFAAAFNQIPKVEATIGTNQSDLSNLAKGYGGTAPKFYKGKYYMRGKKGEAVEVK